MIGCDKNSGFSLIGISRVLRQRHLKNHQSILEINNITIITENYCYSKINPPICFYGPLNVSEANINYKKRQSDIIPKSRSTEAIKKAIFLCFRSEWRLLGYLADTGVAMSAVGIVHLYM